MPDGLRERAEAALREVHAIRYGDWGGDRKWDEFGPTMLARYERLALAAISTEEARAGEMRAVAADLRRIFYLLTVRKLDPDVPAELRTIERYWTVRGIVAKAVKALEGPPGGRPFVTPARPLHGVS